MCCVVFDGFVICLLIVNSLELFFSLWCLIGLLWIFSGFFCDLIGRLNCVVSFGVLV